jgi:hypothetical protein
LLGFSDYRRRLVVLCKFIAGAAEAASAKYRQLFLMTSSNGDWQAEDQRQSRMRIDA